MPKCGACGRNYDNPALIELVRNKEDRWIPICRECLNRRVDVNQLRKENVAVDSHATAASSQAININLSADPIENAKRLLSSLKGLRQSRERIGRARLHERKQADLTVNFTMARDDTRYEATVKDFSQDGIRIVTNKAMAKGQIVQFDWNIPLPPAMAKVLQGTGEARRVSRLDDGAYDVGFKFISRQSDKGANRRRFRRYKCDMVVYYQCRGGCLMTSGRVTDISQGGCQMRLDDRLEHGDVVSVRLIGGGGSRGDLLGDMRVCRVIPREVDFETGCAFEKMRMEQNPGATR